MTTIYLRNNKTWMITGNIGMTKRKPTKIYCRERIKSTELAHYWIKCEKELTEKVQEGSESPIWVPGRTMPQINTIWKLQEKRY